ncbi:MAG: hypothetical protein GX748_08820 [Lentisphaerae bacterium]|nr:hypothetical protein [Lentisphaerota bacterium]
MKPISINFTLKTETKTCYRFETGEKPEQMTLYLKKAQVDAAGIDPRKGITVTIEEAK